MVTEHPEDGRAWADAHEQWSAFASGLFTSVRQAFRVLTAIQFEAPWEADPEIDVASDANEERRAA